MFKERAVTAEFIHQKTADQRIILRRENGLSANDIRDNTPPIDISYQTNRHIGASRETHVRQVMLSEIRLCWTARAFDQNEIVALSQSTKAVVYRSAEILPLVQIVNSP